VKKDSEQTGSSVGTSIMYAQGQVILKNLCLNSFMVTFLQFDYLKCCVIVLCMWQVLVEKMGLPGGYTPSQDSSDLLSMLTSSVHNQYNMSAL
jgi:hypothetical protein